MLLHVIDAKYERDYKVWLKFDDGTEGTVDLSDELYGEVFEPVKDLDFFKQFTLDSETLSWPNGADFAPEYLRKLIA